jgi:hypothetical protein
MLCEQLVCLVTLNRFLYFFGVYTRLTVSTPLQRLVPI